MQKPKKYLSQNFLKSKAALEAMLAAGEVTRGDTVLEIGPGKGVLTEKLLAAGAKVVAVEKDPELFEYLKEKFSQAITANSLVLVHEDILNFYAKAYGLEPSAYKIVANIPYNITGAILKKFLTNPHQPERMVLMVQKEVAERILGKNRRQGGASKESILSISVKAYGKPMMIMKVDARYFSPAPKVDSAIVAITQISREFFEKNEMNEGKFWELVKTSFAHKRKKLGSNLRGLKLAENNFKDKRAEDLSLADWLALAKLR